MLQHILRPIQQDQNYTELQITSSFAEQQGQSETLYPHTLTSPVVVVFLIP